MVPTSEPLGTSLATTATWVRTDVYETGAGDYLPRNRSVRPEVHAAPEEASVATKAGTYLSERGTPSYPRGVTLSDSVAVLRDTPRWTGFRAIWRLTYEA